MVTEVALSAEKLSRVTVATSVLVEFRAKLTDLVVSTSISSIFAARVVPVSSKSDVMVKESVGAEEVAPDGSTQEQSRYHSGPEFFQFLLSDQL